MIFRNRLAAACIVGTLASTGLSLALPTPAFAADKVEEIRVEGVRRVEEETIKSYLTIEKGQEFDPAIIRESIKNLFNTGMFKDVALDREGNALVVKVVENPMIEKVVFTGLDAFTEEELETSLQLKAKAIYNRVKAEKDLAALRQAYRIKGLFLAKISFRLKELDQNRVRLIYDIDEGDKSKVQDVRIMGNKNLSYKELTKPMLIKPSGWFSWLTDDDTYDREKLLYDQEQLRNTYLNNGYVRVRVDTSVAELTPDRRAFAVTHSVEEGEQYKYGTVTINGDFDELPTEALYKELVLTSNGLYSRDEIRQSIDNLTDRVGDFGYAFLDIQPESRIDDEKKTVDLNFKITKGRRVYLNRIEIAGNTRTRDEVVRREIRMAEWDRFSASQMRKAKKRIDALQFFEKVEVTTPRSDIPDRVNLAVKVVEKPTGTFSIGAGYSSIDKALTTASVSQNNFLGRGQKLSLSFTLSARTSSFDLAFTEPYFMGKEMAAGADLYRRTADRRDITGFKSTTIGGGVRTGIPLQEHLTNQTSYYLNQIEIEGVSDRATSLLKEQASKSPYLQSIIGNAVVWNNLDDNLLPSKGRKHRLATDYSGLGGDVTFGRVLTDNSYYNIIPGTKTVVGHVRGKAGLVDGMGKSVPVFERFLMGGARSVRGFDPGGMGPRTKEGDAYGGTYFTQANAELFYPFPGFGDKGVRGFFFADAGQLGDTKNLGPTVYQDDSVRTSVGAGVHWSSPFGPLRFELGFPLQKEPYDETRTFDFTVGAAM